MHTTALLADGARGACASRVREGRAAAIDALRGVGMALETVATLALMCDGRDFGVAMGDVAKGEGDDAGRPTTGEGGGMRRGYDPTLFLYEHVPGGTGLSERVYEQQTSLLASAASLIARCPCEGGCPACVGPAEASVGEGGGA